IRAVIAVGGIWNVAACIAHSGRYDSRFLPEEILHSPEAASGQDRFLGSSVHASNTLRSLASLGSYLERSGDDGASRKRKSAQTAVEAGGRVNVALPTTWTFPSRGRPSDSTVTAED